MTLYELFHSIRPEVLLASIKEANSHNDVLSRLEEHYLPHVLDARPEGGSDGKCVYVLRDYNNRPAVAFDTTLGAEISLSAILSRQVIASDCLKRFPPEKIAALCYCSLPVGIVTEKDGKCRVCRAFDPESKAIVTKTFDYIIPY
ncbi:MAG: hypothetical protein NC301_08600 [Bacteroides sp.]|nr:hypothetical protein [Alistipes timonensis]MCM1311063.1 hypothetical protein [Bacteroides sp.]MCM1405712.1 hypothetical protein [[Clostridium] fimetarium]